MPDCLSLAVKAGAVLTFRTAARAFNTIVRLDVIAFCACAVVVINVPMPNLLGMERRYSA